jgi:hypothetical protein
MQCKTMVLNSLVFWDFRPVFDQNLVMGCSQKKMKSATIGTSRFSMIPRRVWLIFGPKFKLIPKNPTLRRCRDTLRTIPGASEPEQSLAESPYMCADLTRNSGGRAVFNGADQLEEGLAPFAHPSPDANLPIAHRLTGSSAYNATLARTIYTLLTVSEKEFDVLPACKHGCMFAGALRFSRMVL